MGAGLPNGPPSLSPANHAYGAAEVFVAHLASLARFSRESAKATWVSAIETGEGRSAVPPSRKSVGFLFGEAFIAWFDLTHHLNPAVRTKARLAYIPGQPPPRIGGEVAVTVIEYLADDLGTRFRNAVYAGRRHSLEPDIAKLMSDAQKQAAERAERPGTSTGWREDFEELAKAETRVAIRERLEIHSALDGAEFMAKEVKGLSETSMTSALATWCFWKIDFDELAAFLKYEAERVIADEDGQREPGSSPPIHKPDGWTKAELVAQARALLGTFGTGTFDKIRGLAGVPAATKGGAGPHRRYSIAQLCKLIRAARNGRLRRGEEIAKAWEQLLGN